MDERAISSAYDATRTVEYETSLTFAERLATLNYAQREAINCTSGPLLCFAGAGSGKTRVLTTRIAELIQSGEAEPDEILALTFTRKAAEEMRDRLAALVGEDRAGRVALATFHAIGVKILREYGSVIGIGSRFSVADDGTALLHLRRALALHGIERGDPDYRPGDVSERIAAAKSYLSTDLCRRPLAGTSRVDVYRAGDPELFVRAAAEGGLEEVDPIRFSMIYRSYQESMLASDTLDFQDLISLPLLLFEDRPDVLGIFQSRWPHISVDEYQDTDDVQERLLSLLASRSRSLCCVGDDDQAIYGFRNAKVENIRTFTRRYPEARVVRLEENYRSTPDILEVANAVISGQKDRPVEKRLRANRPGGVPVRLWSSESAEAEAEAVVAEASRMLATGEIGDLGDILVLYRVNALGEMIERALHRAELPYRVVGRLRLQDRQEVRDLMGYLRLSCNWNDTASFERVVNVPSRGIGPATMEKILQEARVRLTDPVSICLEADTYLSIRKSQKEALLTFGDIMTKLRRVAQGEGAAALLHAVLEHTGYRENLVDTLADAEMSDDVDAVTQASERLHSIATFTQIVEEHDRRHRAATGRRLSAVDLLDALSVSLAEDDLDEGGRGAVSLMSIHAAKGLEKPVVIVVGVEEGLLPVTARPGEVRPEDDVEEEGRLFYVAITRAEDRLILSSARRRTGRDGLSRPAIRSRFLARIPETGYVIESVS